MAIGHNDVLVEKISKMIKQGQIKSICDYGCGQGYLLQKIREANQS